MLSVFVLCLVILLLVSSINSIWSRSRERHTYLALENVVLLLLIYATVLIGFGIIYVVMWMNGLDVLAENGLPIFGSYFSILKSAMYFSAVTLLSVGYGDITPIGFGRSVAVVEALLGYVIPYAFVVRTVIDLDKK